MESLIGDTEDISEDLPGRKKSKLKILKNLLVRRCKKADEDGSFKLTQSASDITAGQGLGSEEDLMSTQAVLGSRALSHDSIFLANQDLADLEPSIVLSQENVHSKIKALQVKLVQQKLHLGPPPLVPSIKRSDHLSSPLAGESVSQGTFNKEKSQPSTRSLSPAPKPTATTSVAPASSLSAPLAVLSTSPPTAAGLPLDFSSPAQFTSCLDTSAARHRMSVKPKNQRASTKGRRTTTVMYSSPHSDIKNNINHRPFKEEVSGSSAREEIVRLSSQPIQSFQSGQQGVNISFTLLCLQLNSLEPGTFKREPPEAQAAQEPSDSAPQPPQPLEVKAHQPADVTSSQHPESSYMLDDVAEFAVKRENLADKQALSHVRSSISNSSGLVGKNLDSEQSSQGVSVSSRQLSPNSISAGSLTSPAVNHHSQVQRTATEGLQRLFHVSSVKGRDGERPRSSSLLGTGERAAARHMAGSETMVKSLTSNVTLKGQDVQRNRQDEKWRDVKEQGGTSVVATAKDEEARDKAAAFPWERREAAPPIQATITRGALEGTEGSRVGAVEAAEPQEEQGTAAFGVKLRSTSLALKYRSEGTLFASSIKRHSQEMAPPFPLLLPCNPSSVSMLSGEQSDKKEEVASGVSKTLLSCIQGDALTPWSLHQDGGAPGPLVKPDQKEQVGEVVSTPEAQESSVNTKEVETAVEDPQEAQAPPRSTPQSAPPEVSWMSMAMEKTRSLQQLLTSRLPRDFTGIQSNARQPTVKPTTQGQTVSRAQANKGTQSQEQLTTQTHTVTQEHSSQQIQDTSQPLTEAIKPAVMKSAGPAQAAKPSQMTATVQQSISSNTSQSPQMQNTAHPIVQSSKHTVSLPALQANMFVRPSASCPAAQMETMSQSAPGTASQFLTQDNFSSGQQPSLQQPPRGSRGLQSTSQSRPTAAAPTASHTAPSSALASASRGEVEEGACLSGRRTVWQGSFGERAAFLDTEGFSSIGINWVEPSKSQSNRQSVESFNSVLSNKDTERRPGVQLADIPTKVLGRLTDREEKLSRIPIQTSSSTSQSPTPSSPLQSAADRSQPSWMELAKRKSMAWSDKTMD